MLDSNSGAALPGLKGAPVDMPTRPEHKRSRRNRFASTVLPQFCVQPDTFMHERRNNRRLQIMVALICTGAVGYFAAHATQGRHGFHARQSLMERAGLLEAEIERLANVRARLAIDVALLNAPTPDPDLVEELAADLFGVMRPGERRVIGVARQR